jgi:hypothetical protein
MPTTAQIKEVNAALRSRLVKSTKFAKLIDNEEDVALMQRDLDGYADEFGTFINLHVPFDQDVLVGFAELRRIIRNFNDDNREDNGGEDILTIRLPYFEDPSTGEVTTFAIPEPIVGGVKYGRASDSTSTGSGSSGDHAANGTVTYEAGAGVYQKLDGVDDHHDSLHLKAVGVAPDGGCCCSVM